MCHHTGHAWPISRLSSSATYRRRRCLTAALLSLTFLLLTGCGAGLRQWEASNSFMVAADPLCESTPGQVWTGDTTCKAADQATTAASNRAVVMRVVSESEYKCGQFLNGLVLASNTTSTGLDSLTTLFSSLGAVFTPVTVVRGLSAAAAVSSGWNGNIRADIYAQHTIENYAQAIQASYYDNIKAYLTTISAITDDGKINPEDQVPWIALIHKSCALAPAQATISATLQGSATNQTNTFTATVTVTADAAPGDTYTLTGTGGLKLSFKNDTKAKVLAKEVALKLMDQGLDPTGTLAAAKVVVAPAIGIPGFTLTSPTSITWSTTGNLSVDNPQAASTGNAAPAAPGAASPPGSGAAPGAASAAPTNGNAAALLSTRIRSPGASLR